jgi:hypothetical protein
MGGVEDELSLICIKYKHAMALRQTSAQQAAVKY